MISVKGLKKNYNGFTAVDGISFDVAKGEIFAFLGPNGAGKTTTIKMLTTLLKPTAGEMRLNGADPTVDRDEVRASFGIVFQDPSLDEELTAYENLEFHGVLYGIPKTRRRERIGKMLELMELTDRKDDLVKKFSGGMKRRLEIARGFLHHPRILFLDEPTLGLDPQTRYHIWEHIRYLNREEGVTVFLTTHHMEEVERVAGRVAIIDSGKIVGQGTIEELKSKTGGETLEDAFLALTGHGIRDEEANSTERMRLNHRAWKRK
jgi:ABC-2 type transport system ATP-binding protein